MGNGEIIGRCFKADNRPILHADTEQPREYSFRSSSHIEIFFEGLRAVIDLITDILINMGVSIPSLLNYFNIHQIEGIQK